jgi:uncharacterized protein Usg
MDILPAPERRFVTAEIIYRLPDYPRLRRFLEYWSLNLEGRLHSVVVRYAGDSAPRDFSHFGPGRNIQFH